MTREPAVAFERVALLYDPATRKVGEYQHRCGPYALLRPVGGRREWPADPAALRPATQQERLRAESPGFALPGRAAEFEVPHAAPLPDLLDSILAAGRVTLCTQCAARRGISEKDVIDGVRIAGAQVFVQEALADDTQALVY